MFGDLELLRGDKFSRKCTWKKENRVVGGGRSSNIEKEISKLLVFIAKVYFCFRKVGNLVTPATGSKKPLNLKTQMVAPKFDIR